MRGQALVLALFLAVLCAAALVQLFNGGQLVHDKTRLANAADAAAYSGALVQARALNFQAYANRSQIAHQVAMAHLVTLGSWAQFGATQGQQMANFNPPVHVISMFFGAAHGAGYTSALGAIGLGGEGESSGALGAAHAEHDRIVHEVLAGAQAAVMASLPAVRQHTMQAVLDANYGQGDTARADSSGLALLRREAGTAAAGDGQRLARMTAASTASAPRGPAVVLDTQLLADALPDYVRQYSGTGRARLRSTVLQAADHYGFLAPRNHTERNGWPVQMRCPQLRHELRRRGDTSLEGYGPWRAYDTESYHALRSNQYIGCYYREYPMGWGAVEGGGGDIGQGQVYVDNPPDDFSQQDYWRWVQEHGAWDVANTAMAWLANPLAHSRAVFNGGHWPGRGLPGHPDVTSAQATADAPLRFAIRVTRHASHVPTTDGASHVNAGHRLLRFDTTLAGDALAATSAGETYFARPAPRGDGRRELASLFHPYWQARLGPVTDSERQTAWRRQGGAS